MNYSSSQVSQNKQSLCTPLPRDFTLYAECSEPV